MLLLISVVDIQDSNIRFIDLLTQGFPKRGVVRCRGRLWLVMGEPEVFGIQPDGSLLPASERLWKVRRVLWARLPLLTESPSVHSLVVSEGDETLLWVERWDDEVSRMPDLRSAVGAAYRTRQVPVSPPG